MDEGQPIYEIKVVVQAAGWDEIKPIVDRMKKCVCSEADINHPGRCPHPWTVITSELVGEDAAKYEGMLDD